MCLCIYAFCILHSKMKQFIPILLFWLLWIPSYSQDEAAQAILARREKVNKEFQDSNTSPLDPGDKKKFEGLNYFSIDPGYRLTARFVRTEKPVIFKMKMTASPRMEYTTVAYVAFDLQGIGYKLMAYKKPETEAAYFIPFSDATNGKETYESGRYVDFPVPSNEDVILDFNGAYNPYCAYSRRFSCPIPPPENKVTVAIRAGEKKFKESH